MSTPEELTETQYSEGIDVTIARETRRIMSQWLAVPHESPQIEVEAARLQELTERQAMLFEQKTMGEWRAANPATPMKFAETVQMQQSAWRAARELVLEQELYQRVTPELRAEIEETDSMIAAMVEQTIAERRAQKDPERWKQFHVQVTPLAQKIVNRVWGRTDLAFQIRAEALVQQRLEDNQRTPTTAVDPIAPELAAMVDAQIAVTPPEKLPF